MKNEDRKDLVTASVTEMMEKVQRIHPNVFLLPLSDVR